MTIEEQLAALAARVSRLESVGVVKKGLVDLDYQRAERERCARVAAADEERRLSRAASRAKTIAAARPDWVALELAPGVGKIRVPYVDGTARHVLGIDRVGKRPDNDDYPVRAIVRASLPRDVREIADAIARGDVVVAAPPSDAELADALREIGQLL